MIHFASYFAANLEIEIPGLGCKVDRMGHCLISNVGTLDLDYAFAPLCSPMFAQIVGCIGRISKKPVYDPETDSIKAEEILTSVLTFDHRFGDAAQGSRLIKAISSYIENPESTEKRVEDKKME